MPFIEKTETGFNIDDSNYGEKAIIKAFGLLLENKGFDFGRITCGVRPSPDFGYFELADRFWRASLGIYALGSTFCFPGRGIGYSEPWLFNARHSIELYLKGFTLNTIWFEELQMDSALSTKKSNIHQLMKKFSKPHRIDDLYTGYREKIVAVKQEWVSEHIPDAPDLDRFLLSETLVEMLKELDESDETSFRFRYPSLRVDGVDQLQETGWQHDANNLYSVTGLPKKSGYFFNHLAVMNNLHKLVKSLQVIRDGFISYNEYQQVMNEYLADFESDFADYY